MSAWKQEKFINLISTKEGLYLVNDPPKILNLISIKEGLESGHEKT